MHIPPKSHYFRQNSKKGSFHGKKPKILIISGWEKLLYSKPVEQGPLWSSQIFEEISRMWRIWQPFWMKSIRTGSGLGYYPEREIFISSKGNRWDTSGCFSKRGEQVIELKGVGEYTAAAIVSHLHMINPCGIRWNVFRVLSRYSGIDIPGRYRGR